MTKFENMINNGQMGIRTIDVMVIDLNKEDNFDANINALTLEEVDQKLPEGYEMNTESTLSNYFEPATVQEFITELVNSKYIYSEDFDVLYEGGFYEYIEALKASDGQKIMKMDRKYK